MSNFSACFFPNKIKNIPCPTCHPTFIGRIWTLDEFVQCPERWNAAALKFEGPFHWRIWGHVTCISWGAPPLSSSGHQEYSFCKGSLLYRTNKRYLFDITRWSMMYLHNYPKDPWDWYIYLHFSIDKIIHGLVNIPLGLWIQCVWKSHRNLLSIAVSGSLNRW